MSAFFDTNVLVYAQQQNAKGDRAREVLARGGFVSVQVLNEFASVSSRKFGRSWLEIAEAISDVTAVTAPPIALTNALHDTARALAEKHMLSFYEALVIAAALEAGCSVLLSEDMQAGRRFGDLTIENPFTVAR